MAVLGPRARLSSATFRQYKFECRVSFPCTVVQRGFASVNLAWTRGRTFGRFSHKLGRARIAW